MSSLTDIENNIPIKITKDYISFRNSTMNKTGLTLECESSLTTITIMQCLL